ncbi:MAG: Vacuolar protein sorting-associated protein 62 [Bogoriella megaspora]|nr:MAG: Vacuolar protein sorting-associated protein 62 [Bogoriella megaspora]
MADTKVVLITGANRGIGNALVGAFLSREKTVVVACVRDTTTSSSQHLSSLVTAKGSKLIIAKIDSGSDTDARQATIALEQEHGITKLDMVIANAGMGDVAESVLSTQPAAVRRHIDVNAVGVLSLFQATESLLRKAAAPKFFAMSSNLASLGIMEYIPGPWLAYGMSKAALNFLIRKIHFENEWLTAVVLSPGWVQTDMGDFAAKALGVEAAPVTLKDSVRGVLGVIDGSSRERFSGSFVSHEGEVVPCGGQAPLIPFDSLTTPLSSSTLPVVPSSTLVAQVASTETLTPSIWNEQAPTPFPDHTFYEDIGSSHELPKIPQCSTAVFPKHTSPSRLVDVRRKALRFPAAALTMISSLFGRRGFLGLNHQLYLDNFGVTGSAAESRWLESSYSWVDKSACKWIGFCDSSSSAKNQWTGVGGEEASRASMESKEKGRLRNEYWNSGKTRPDDWSDHERRLREIPQYVLDYAPFVHLYSGEEFWPCDIADHVFHTTPHLNFTPLREKDDPPNITNLNELNRYKAHQVYLQSDDDVEERPEWLGGKSNIPTVPDDLECKFRDRSHNTGVDAAEHRIKTNLRGSNNIFGQKEQSGRTPGSVFDSIKEKPCGGRSDAPATLVVIDKGNGIVDAFWFFFYSYNLGNVVLNVRFGNHVGDWEHTLVRFKYGEPIEIFFSEHNFGEAYAYHAVEKIGKRPVAYSATGTHAMYGTPGTHAYILPWGLLHDETDRGPLWDPTLNLFSYTYQLPKKPFEDPDDPELHEVTPSALPSDLAGPIDTSATPQDLNSTFGRAILRASTLTPKAPLEWFLYRGHWGDKKYPLDDSRQYRFAGQYHYVDGPTGPWAKNLARKNICQSPGKCIIRHWMDEGVGGVTVRVLEEWNEYGDDEGAEWEEIDLPGPIEAPGDLHD